MKIILVGGGKVGTALARQLSEEDHNVTIVDTNKARVEHLTESYDVLGIVGNGSSITTLAEAGIEDADVFIAVTGSDELNLLCCMFAKKAGHCHAIARVRNPSYSHELDFIKKQIGISAIINPEMAAAKEISHLLRFPGASKIDTFADGRVRLIKFALTAEQGLDGVAIREIPTRLKSDILVCAVERSGGVIIPNGNFVLQNGDQVTFLATQEKAHEFFQRIHLPVRPVRNAFIVGGGAIAFYLSQELLENHVRVRIVERDPARCMELAEQLPGAQILNEDGSNREFLLSEGMESTEAFVALTNIDEENVLLTLFAKKAGHCHAIARVRNPSYSHELDFIKKQIGISAIINPEMAAAREISHLLRFPGASKIDTFAEGRVRLIKFTLTEAQALDGVAIREIPTRLKSDILVCAVERDGGVIIPNGNFVLQTGDQVTFLATQEKAHEFFQRIHLAVRPVRNALIVGGGAIAFYLSQELLENHVRVRIVERDPARCDVLAQALPEAQILCEDGSNREFLLSEGLTSTEAFVALTNIDEENVLLTLFAKKHSNGKLVTKINRLEFDDILAGLDLGSIVYPKYMTCDYIVQYVRALQNEAGSNIKTLYRILDDRVEALEFTVHEKSRATGVPLSQLHLKKNLLLCCITRGNEIKIPRGGDEIQVGDNVIVVTLEHGLHDLRDIVED